MASGVTVLEPHNATVSSVIFLPVSAVRAYSISTKLSVWRRWNVEPRPLPSDMYGDNSDNDDATRYSWRL